MDFLQLINNTKSMQEVFRLQKNSKQLSLQGLKDIHRIYAAAGVIYGQPDCAAMVLVKSRAQVRAYSQLFGSLLPDWDVYELSAEDILVDHTRQENHELLANRFQTLSSLYHSKRCIVYATVDNYLRKYPHTKQFEQSGLEIRIGQELSVDKLLADLIDYGYTRVDKVYDIGEFALRGDILDIRPLNAEYAVRIEFFSETVDGMRYFDVLTQRSVVNLEELEILPLKSFADKSGSIFDYLKNNLLIIDEEAAVFEQAEILLAGLESEILQHYISYAQLVSGQQALFSVDLTFAGTAAPVKRTAYSLLLDTTDSYHRQVDIFINRAKEYLSAKKTIILAMSNLAKARAISKNMGDLLPITFVDDNKSINSHTVNCIVANLQDGFYLPQDNLLVVTEKDLFGMVKQRKFAVGDDTSKITYFTDININDYVVHNIHGIGQYIGIEKIEVDGLLKDYIVLQYAGTDKLYVLADQVSSLHKYIGNDGVPPKLSNIGGSDWQRLRNKAKLAITDMAQELLRIYAQREIVQGYAFPADDNWQQEFEDAFEYEETPDQLRAIAEIKADMQSTRPMDRLLCGDVGYGKTEVAMRAAYKAVLAGKQVAVLVPTTILARQHLQTFSERMSAFGVRVQALSRFNSTKEQKQVLKDLSEGRVDLVIATHRILQNDILFKDLGLLIIDEEQRFGLAQKERIKKLAVNIDVLTLSATPIPRTLHMTLLTAKDMSVIETAPESKMAIETYVIPEKDEIIANAIRRELRRGGRVYYVVRFIEHLDYALRRLGQLVPEASIAIAHGQMPEGALEKSIIKFYDGDCDILLSTSIVENGLDVPQANTIIIQDADGFGLSQLYQMRGRVGRGIHLAYSYLLYKPQKSISEIAQKRLDAIRSFTELGAGFKIAMRDLEIRGSGSILGSKQHGHVLSIGFQAYCQLLEETITYLKGSADGTISVFEPTIDIAVNMHISSEYMPNNSDKLEVYKRLAVISSVQDEQDLLDELIDRFGTPPADLMAMLKIALIRSICRKYGIRTIVAKGREISFVFAENCTVSGEQIIQLLDTYKKQSRALQGANPRIVIKVENGINYLKTVEKIINILLPNTL
mgnify:CR=1 FL=1